MVHSERCTQLVAQFEGYASKAYKDQGGTVTIGYGHTRNVKMGDTCTKPQALLWLDVDLHEADEAVTRLLKVPVTQNEFDALVSFTYNVGQGNLADSRLLELLNEDKKAQAAEHFAEWNLIGKTKVAGLSRRRLAEKIMFEGNQ